MSTQKSDCKNFTNYSLTKTIRFLLKPVDYTPSEQNINIFELLENFCKIYGEVIDGFENLVFCKKKDSLELSGKIKIKHGWLKTYTKSEFFAAKDRIVKFDNKGRKQSNKIIINEPSVSFLKEYFEKWITENKECIEALNVFLNTSEENQKRRSEAAFWLAKINKRSNFEFIYELFNENIEHEIDNKDISAIFYNLQKCKKNLSEFIDVFRPSQSFGVEIERASLNYYTVNKKPKDYDKEVKNKENELTKKLFDFKKFNKKNQEQESLFNLKHPFKKLLEEENKNLKDDCFAEENFNGIVKVIKDFNHLKINCAYKFLKEYIASQKSKFYELLKKGQANEKINKNCPLFSCSSENFDKIKGLTDKLDSSEDKKVRENLKQQRDKHFDVVTDNGNFCSFENYKEIYSLFQSVAMKLDNIKAEIKALEKERVDAEKLTSWAIIAEHDNQKYIILIPRNAQNNLPNAKKYIDDLTDTPNSPWRLFVFESLTLRALDKLCFGFDKNTFMAPGSPVYKELQTTHQTYFESGKLKRKDQFSEDGTELIKFYQAVLSLEATKSVLAIDKFDGLVQVLKKEYESIEDFEVDLKKSCYYKREIIVSEDVKNQIVQNYSAKVYKITSYDLEKNDTEVLAQTTKSALDRNHPERHTKMWLDFWTSGNNNEKYPIRLNPELKISFVEARPDELEGRELGQLKKNRRNEKQFILSTTISVNSHGKNVDLSFKTEDEVKKFFDGFNKEFNSNSKRKPFEQYYYGLDRGQKELLTLGVFKFSESEKVTYTKNDGSDGKYQKPEFIDLEVYRIKADKLTYQNQKGRVAYKSPDQFIDNEAVIEKIAVSSCLDLSCAKLIKGKIVLNGDIATYLALKMAGAKRKIYEGATRGKFTSDHICFNADKQSFFLNYENRGKTENEDLYFWDDRFSIITTQDQIKSELQAYYDQVKAKQNYELVTIEKVNHLRDAICANAVGIMHHLYVKFPGMIAFEDLDNGNKEQRLREFAGNLASRIEQKVLQKFQTDGLVPPALKRIMDMQSQKEISQLGCVVYVKTEGTSSQCPHCETENTDQSEKWGAHAYVCTNKNCGFDSKDIEKRKGLDALDDSDKVATYNIAKRCLKFFDSSI